VVVFYDVPATGACWCQTVGEFLGTVRGDGGAYVPRYVREG
jgi:hypothetical protein